MRNRGLWSIKRRAVRGAGARALLAVREHIFAERPAAATTGRGGAGQRQRKRAELAAGEERAEKAQASRDVAAGRPRAGARRKLCLSAQHRTK